MKKTTKLWLSMLAITSAMTVGCVEEPQEPPADCDPACTGDQVCENGKCVDKPSVVDEDKCKDVLCEGEQTCNKETGKCEGGDDPAKCTDGLEDCNGNCVNFMTDKTNCGGCGISCGDKECENGTCQQDVVVQCDINEAPTCDGNSVKKCTESGYQLEDCGDGALCTEGACKNYECDDTTPASCEGNIRKFCKDKFLESEDCGSKTCEDGVCTDAVFEKECEDTDKPKCNDEENLALTCVGGKWNPQVCGALTCIDGSCQEVVAEPECKHGEFAITCANETTKRDCGEENKFVDTACEAGEICLEGACKSTTIEDLCPDDEAKTAPGVCGCGIADVDFDENGVADCQDAVNSKDAVDFCPDDPDKVLPGICGCNIPDTLDGNGNPLCVASLKDFCPNDEGKLLPGTCGCNIPDTINVFTGLPWCVGMGKNGLPYDVCKGSAKYVHGVCGCGVEDSLGADGLTPECVPTPSQEDLCPDDEAKTNPGACGCGVEDTDTDGDGVANCLDAYPENKYTYYVSGGCNKTEIPVLIDGKDYCATPIETAEDFINIRNRIVNGELLNTTKEVYALMNDIDLGTVFTSSEIDWKSIDNFAGKLVSTGKTISYTHNGEVATLKCAATRCGLFNSLNNARIHNVNLNFNVVAKTGEYDTGLLAGSAAGTTHVSNVQAKGNVKSSGNRTGGLIGSAYGTYSNISVEGNVESTNSPREIGGVIGFLYPNAIATNISHKGDVTAIGKDATHGSVGGVFGSVLKNGVLTNITNEGNVSGCQSVGGILGWALNGEKLTLTKATNSGTVKGDRLVGGIAGQLQGDITNVTNHADVIVNNQLGSAYVYTGGIVGQAHGGFVFDNITNTGKVDVVCDPRTYTDSSTGLPTQDYATCYYTGGLFGVIENHSTRGTIVKNASNTADVSNKSYYLGGIAGRCITADFINVSNSGNVTGAGYLGGIVGFHDLQAGRTGVEYKMENVINTGNIDGTTHHFVGGIHGLYYTVQSTTHHQVVNKGNVSTTQNYVGGLFGLYCHFDNDVFTDVYSTGDVTGNEIVGGIIGSMHIDESSVFTTTSAKRDMGVTIDKAYYKGNISGKAQVGGLIGRMNIDAYNRSQSTVTVKCPTNEAIYTTNYTYTYYPYTETFIIRNAYTEGRITSSGNYTGGIIGYVSGTSGSKTYNTNTSAYDNNCKSTNTQTPAPTGDGSGSIIGTSKLIISNVYSAATVNSASSYTGGLIGWISYTNNTGSDSNNAIFNNVYATGDVQETSGALFGHKPTFTYVNFKSTYYWPESGSDNICATAMDVQGITPFGYNKGTATLLKADDTYGDKLLDKLNSNRVASLDPELSSSISSPWSGKNFTLGNSLDVNIPTFDFEPIDWQKEAGRE